MKLEGSYRISAPRQRVWEALLNPDVLRRVIPGCEKLDVTGDHRYNATFRAGVGQIKGTFSGEIEITDLDPQSAYTLRSRMKAAVGFVEGSGRISLGDSETAPQETLLTYSGEVKIGGLVASIAGRLIEAAAKKNMDDMFANLSRELMHPAAPQP
jgi:carbon monoxide dehydrogenase subunit G